MNRPKNNQHIQVYVRSRPLNAQERVTTLSVVDILPEHKEVRVRKTKIFKFDKVFGPTSTQVDVFNTVMTPVLEEVLMGYNCTVFVYGQTGSGKTYTMEGEHSLDNLWEKNSRTGIIPRALSRLFDNLQKQEVEYTLHISFLELYNEELFDLLGPENNLVKLRLFEDITHKGSVVIQGLQEIAVHTKEEVHSILERGSAKRKTAATNMNATSSRSHTVFSITIHMKETTSNGDELLKTGKLNLVDLAGSENISRSGAVDIRAREAGSINQSLLTLGRVITALVEKAPHIPYRESKLTRLLQDSLGGKTKTTIIATISPAAADLDETLSTLEYAHRAKKITNCPEVNQKTTKQALLKEYTQEIERLRRDLAAAREKNGIFIDPNNYQNMQLELSCKEETLKELSSTIECLKVEMEKVNNLFAKTEEELTVKTAELESCSKELVVKSEKLEEKSKELQDTKEILNKTEIERAEHAHLAEERAKTEKKLVSQAKKLIEIADESTSDVYALHAKLDRKCTVEVANEQHNSEFRQKFDQSMRKLTNHLTQMCQKHVEGSELLHNSIDKTMQTYEENSKLLSAVVSELISKHAASVENATTELSEQAKAEDEWRSNLVKVVLRHKDDAVNSCNTYITEKVSPLLDEISSIHHIMDDQICKMKELCHQQHMKQQENINVFTEKFGEDIEEFKKDFSLYSSSIESQLIKCAEYANYIAENQAVIVKQYEQKKIEYEKLACSLNELTNSFKENMNRTLPMLLQHHSQLLVDNNSNKSNIEGYVEEMAFKNDAFKRAAIEEARSNMLNEGNNLDKIRDGTNEILDKNNTMKTNVMEFQDCTAQMWDSYIELLQKNLDKHAETKKQNLTRNLQLVEEMNILTTNAQRHHEEVLNSQRKDFESNILSQKTENSVLQETMKHQIESLLENVEASKEDVNLYITNWQTDIPTGETPQRKDYNFPRTVPETSPAERILQRFRTFRSDQVPNRKSPLKSKQNEPEGHEVFFQDIASKKTYDRDSGSTRIPKLPKKISQIDKSEDKENTAC